MIQRWIRWVLFICGALLGIVAAAWVGGKDAVGCQEYDLTAHAPDYAPGLIRVRPKRGGLRNVDFVLEKKSSLAGRAVDTRGRPAAKRSIKLVYQNP